MTQTTNQVAQQSIEALAEKFKALPFGTKLFYEGTDKEYVLLSADAEGIRVASKETIYYLYFDDYTCFPYLTEAEYEAHKKQKSLEVMYPIGTPVVAARKRCGTVYCFKVGGHSSEYHMPGLRSGGEAGQVGLFPVADYDFFVVGDQYTLVKAS